VKLIGAHIKNFRSISDSGALVCEDLMVFIGKNNAGKSNFLKALDVFFTGKLSPEDIPFGFDFSNDSMEITLTFDDLPSSFRERFDLSPGEHFVFTKQYPVSSKKKISTPKLFLNNDDLIKKCKDLGFRTKSELVAYLEQYLPKYYYVPALRNISDEGKFKRGSLIQSLLLPYLEDTELVSHLSAIQSILEEKSLAIENNVNAIFKDRIEEFDHLTLSFDNMNIAKLLDPVILVKNKNFPDLLPAVEQGAGTQNFIILALAQFNAHHQDDSQSLIIAFEEPEISLHYRAQHHMFDAIKDIIKTNKNQQIFLTTHSTVFIDQSIEHIFEVKKEKGITYILPFKRKDVIDLLGLRGSDFFLSDALVFVEGICDYQVYRTWAEALQLFENIKVTFVPIGGLFSFLDIETEDFLQLTTRVYAIIDSDKRHATDTLHKTNQQTVAKIKELVGGKIHVLERRNLENYFTFEAVNELWPDGQRVIDRSKFNDHYSDMKTHLTEIIREDRRVYYTQRGDYDDEKNKRIHYSPQDAKKIAQKMVERKELPDEIIIIFEKLKDQLEKIF
jgi:putative ATP-dependent endonuclease of OLD family